MKKFLALLLAAMMVFSCTAVLAEEGGFDEHPVGPEEDSEKDVQVTEGSSLHVAAVYFQAVDMYPAENALSAEEANMHIEADISWNANKLGFGEGDWLPFATIEYIIKDAEGNEVMSGSFMPMNASDGPHYGANIKLEQAGIYSLTFRIHSPAENGYLLHIDAETGVEEHSFWTEPVEVTFENWDPILDL